MSPAPAVPLLLTVVFALTGLASLVEYARIVATPRAGTAAVEARAVAILHLLMSVAMIAMAWGLGGGPATASGMIQIAVFGLFALGFGVGATLPTTVRASRSFHAVAALAMVWMVAAMPALMGVTGTAGGTGHDMAGMPGMDMGGTSAASVAPVGPAPGWILGLTGVLVAALTVAALWWLLALVRAPARAALAASLPAGTCCRPSRWACCHVLMSGGMAAMLATML